ncbi:hypothetical protein [Shewanella sp.]|uniref:hypothetical protein n=1 Tax=Shewanella sp. TaxID=50422 RepID=UPI003F3B154F
MKCISVVALLSLSMLLQPAAAQTLQPIIISYAVQPVSDFNQQLLKAQAQRQTWANDPSQISSHYAGNKFTLLRSQAYKGSVVTYQVSELSAQHPQMLLILSLKKNTQHWQVNSAQLAWKCHDSQHFGTDRCSMAEAQHSTAP